MKKSFILVLGLLLVLALVACGEDTTAQITTAASTTTTASVNDTTSPLTTLVNTTTAVESTTTEQLPDVLLDYPSNLMVDGTVLTWTGVAGATSYDVYGNDVLLGNTTSTSYDFGSETDSQIIFQVQAKGGTGYLDSAMSLTIGYLSDYSTELAAIDDYLSTDIGMSNSYDLALELTRKGLTLTDVQGIEIAINSVMNNISMTVDLALSTILNVYGDNTVFEGVLSALVTVTLPDTLADIITAIEDDLVIMQDIHDNPATDPEVVAQYDELIPQTQEYLSLFNNLLALAESNPDALVMSLRETFAYLTDVIYYISPAFIEDVNDLLMNTSGLLDPEEIVLVIEELVSILQDAEPTHLDFMLMYSFIEAFTEAVDDDSIFTSVDMLYDRLATQTENTLQALYLWLENFDATYFQDMMDIFESETLNEYEIQYQAISLNIQYQDQYFDDNETLLESISEAFTMNESESFFDLFTSSISLDYLDLAEVMAIPSFSDIYNLSTMFGTIFQTTLNQLALDDSLVWDLIVMNAFDSYYDGTTTVYYNDALDVDYPSYEVYRYERTASTNIFYADLFSLLGSITDYLSPEQFNDFAVYFFGELIYSQFNSNYEVNSELVSLYGEIFMYLMSENYTEVYGLVTDFIDYVTGEEIYIGVADLLQTMATAGNVDANANDVTRVYFLQSFSAFFTAERLTVMNTLVNSFFTEYKNSDYVAENEISLSSINTMQLNALNVFSILAMASIQFDGVDPSALTETDLNALDAYMDNLGAAMDASFGALTVYMPR